MQSQCHNAGIALVALLVGSVGIATTMFTSVTERTREIGIMKAIGAQNSTILALFLVEALIIGLLGAVIGSSVGVGGGYDDDVVVYESIWTRQQTIFNRVINKNRHL